MSYMNLSLQKCEPGWGYDCRTGLFIPISDVGNLVTYSYDKNLSFYYKQNPFPPICFLNYDNIAHWLINENPNIHKFMDFYFANYQTCEFAFNAVCYTKYIQAVKLVNYPQEATHFVERVYYGMYMWIFFDKEKGHLFDENGRDKFLERIWKGEQKLTKEQENAECSVLIFAKNPEETTVKKMKLNEVLEFFMDFKNGKYPEYETAFSCCVSEITERKSVFNEKFQERFAIIGEKCFKSLTLSDVIFGDAHLMDSQTIVMDKILFYSMKQNILQCLKMKMVLLNNVNEPQIWSHANMKKISFGFVVNREQFKQETIDSSKIFVSACPEKCTNDDRQWICINCGNCFKSDGFDVICDCGTTHVSNLDYECCDPKHPKTISLWKKNESVAAVSAPEIVQDVLLESIKQQLKKHAEPNQLSGPESENKFPALFFDKSSVFFLKMETIQQLKMPIILSNDVEKPYVWNRVFSKKMLLGFASYANQPTGETVETNEIFVMHCPKRCSKDARQWICIDCRLFLKVNGFDVVCDCGVFNITDLIFECFEPTHSKTFTVWQTLPLPAATDFTDEQKSMLEAIKQQLEKIAKQSGMSADDKLSSVIQFMDNPDGSIFDQLEALDLNNFDGDTVDLIHNFLGSSK